MLTEMSQRMMRAYWTARSQKCKQENGQNASHVLMIVLFESCGGYPGANIREAGVSLRSPPSFCCVLNRLERVLVTHSLFNRGILLDYRFPHIFSTSDLGMMAWAA